MSKETFVHIKPQVTIVKINSLLTLALFLAMCGSAIGVTITDEPFNAIPDDGKDDTMAIQAAIDSLPGGGHVIIPAGTFNVSMVKKGITIKASYIKLIIQGDLVVTTGGKESQDCDNLFTITGAYCHIVGEGGMVRGEGKPLLGGSDLIEMGIPPGPRIKEILNKLLDTRLDGKVKTREDEEGMVREWTNG